MCRIGQPADVAALALFLASDAARYINGGIYAVDGGESVTSAYS
jgi:NAD(P)-dependent dehydrogenase (short-subunit alcohol dehydrogenase family)